jgi:exodeoxyribonuclease V gamma subunit
MASLHLYTGNRLETLAGSLADLLRAADASPLERSVILVQSKGMESWLSLTLAQRFGIWANFEFPFPNALIDRIITEAVEDKEESADPFGRELLTLRILTLLPELLPDPRFRPLSHFLESGPQELKGYQLARRLSHLFDQYSVYRPEMLLAWEEGQEDDWQAELWRRLVAATPHSHRARRQQEFLHRCAEQSLPRSLFPPAIHLFGVSALPAYHIDVLVAAAAFCRVNLFLLNPCREYWFDILSPKAAARQEARAAGGQANAGDLHFEVGHPLLASWGRAGRDFFEMLWEKGEPQEENLFAEPAAKSLLGALQSDLLHLRDRSAAPEKTAVAPGDRSLEIHSCHTPLREIEVLHDYLLGCFRDDPGLTPGEVLVMAPDISAYAPYISAVFGAASPRQIPFAVADLSRKRENRLTSRFFDLLGLRHSRRTAPQLLDLLDAPEIMARFRISPPDLERITYWIETLGIRWGLDAADRARFGVPPFPENSWQAGLDRLLLGYALPDGGSLFGEISPADGVEGESARILGCLAEFMAAIDELVAGLEQPRPLDQWGEFFLTLLQRFFDPGNDSDGGFFLLEELFRALTAEARAAGPDRPVEIDVAEAWLNDRFDSAFSSTGRFLSGGVTFAALLPMRSIPFKVIALIGMNDGAFPRSASPEEFDRIAAAPRRGDRSLRHEDRYLFLETLVSARERLYLSYLGQSVRDNSPLPPSVLVIELLDYLQKGFSFDPDRLLIRHRLQAFHPACFLPGSPNASFSAENFRAALALQEGPAPGETRLRPLPPPAEAWDEIELSQLTAFLLHPAAFFARQRLGLVFRGLPAPLEEREPFELDPLERYRLGQELTDAVLAGAEPRDFYPRLRSEGRLPKGEAGRIAFTGLALEAKGFAGRIRAAAAGERREQAPFAVEIEGTRLTGSLPLIIGGQALHHRFARIRARDLLTAWLERLILDLLEEQPAPGGSLVFGREDGCRYRPVSEAPALLKGLLEIFRDGLTRPLPFFPETSLAYAGERLRHPDRPESARQAARHSWEGNGFQAGEREDPCWRYCFGRTDPLDKEFERLSAAICSPLLNHQEKLP